MIDEKLHRAIDELFVQNPDWRDRRTNINPWLCGDYTEAYVRLGSHRILNKVECRTFDLANIVVEPKFRGQEVLTNLLAFLETKGLPLFMENVIDPRFQQFFERRGYHSVPTQLGTARSYFYIQPNADLSLNPSAGPVPF